MGFGVFVQLSSPLILQDNHILNMGESFLIANLVGVSDALKDEQRRSESIEESADRVPKLRLKMFGGPCTGEVFYFTRGDRLQLGRSQHCDVMIEDGLLSKKQCIIEAQENNWILWDGDGVKPSTNGT